MKHGPKVLLFLGAGASSFAGYYTFVGFPELLFDSHLREAGGMPPLSPNPERILQAIRKSLESNSIPTTHDNFLWRLDDYNQFLRLNRVDDVLQEYVRDSSSKFHDLYICTEQAIDQISTTTIHHYSTNCVDRAKRTDEARFNRMKRVFNLYHTLATLNGDVPFLPVFTTNYDMLIEDLTREFGAATQPAVTLVNGISNLVQEEAPWSPKEYPGHEGGFHLYRLHGCVCWFYHHNDNTIRFHRRDATHIDNIKRLCAMYPGRETAIGTDPHGYGFRMLYRYLLDCELIVFIGFSFRDDDVMHVLLKALSERRNKPKILNVDPLYTRFDVARRLEDAASRSPLPSRIPKEIEIESLTMRFGEDERSDMQIVAACQRLIES